MILFTQRSTYAVLLLLIPYLLLAQATVSDNTGASLPSLDKCLSTSIGTEDITIDFPDSGDVSGTATVSLNFSGSHYVCGSIATVSGATITEIDCTDPSMPLFTVTGLDVTNNVRFTFDLTASCGSSSTMPNDIIVNVSDADTDDCTDCGTVQYNVDEAVVQISSSHPNETNLTVGSTGMVDITLLSSGEGDIDEVVFCIDDASQYVCTNALTLPGGATVAADATLSTATQTCYVINAGALAGDMNGLFENGENLVVTRSYEIKGCDVPGGAINNDYSVDYGCDSSSGDFELCQNSGSTPGVFVLEFGQPNVSHSVEIITRSNLCNDMVIEVTYTNNGTGGTDAAAAYNLKVENGIQGDDDDPEIESPDWVITTFQFPDGTTITSTPTVAGGIANFDQFTMDPDGMGGLDDLDGDGQFDDLPAGESVVYRIVITHTCPVDTDPSLGGCSILDQDPLSRYGFNVMYTDLCDEMELLEGTVPGIFDAQRTLSTQSAFASPPNVGDGECFTAFVDLTYLTNIGQSGCNADSDGNGPRVEITYELPAGVMPVAGSATYDNFGDGPVTETISGSMVTLAGDLSSQGSTTPIGFAMDFKLDCAVFSGSIFIPFEVNVICDESCACTLPVTCGTIEAVALCPSICMQGGLTPNSIDFRRTANSLGYTDPMATTTVDPATLSDIQLKRMLPCDEVKLTLDAIQNAGANTPSDNAYVEVAYELVGGGRVFMPIEGTFTVTDASTGMTSAPIMLPTPTETDVNGDHVMLWDLSALLPGGMIDENDQISFCATFTVLDNADLPNIPQPLANATVSTFNLAAGDTDPSPDGDPRITCVGLILEAYPFRMPVNSRTGPFLPGGCAEGNFTLSWEILDGPSFDPFPGEIRPWVIIDEIFVDLSDAGLIVDPNNTAFIVVRGAEPVYDAGNSPNGGETTNNVTLDIVTGSTFTIINDNFLDFDLPDYSPLQNRVSLIVPVLPTCAVDNGSIEVDVSFYGVGAQNRDTDCSPIVNPVGSLIASTTLPSQNLADLSGNKPGDEAVECFTVRVQNDSNFDTDNTFLEFLDQTSSMNVVSAAIVVGAPDGPTTVDDIPLSLQAYSEGQWAGLPSTLPALEAVDIELCVTYDGCDPAVLTVAQGFDCVGLPNPDPAALRCDSNAVELMLVPAIAQLQSVLLQQPASPVDACMPLVYEFRVTSAESANVLNPLVDINVPAGMTIQIVEVGYPYDASAGNPYTATVETLTPSSTTATATIDLNDHTGVNGFLPGTANENATDAPLEDRQALVRVTFLTDCSFVSGSQIPITVSGNAPCGDLATTLLLTDPIDINGISADIEANIGTVADVAPGCGTSTINQTISYEDRTDVAADGSHTVGNDDIVTITLPAGMSYVPSSYMPDDANAPTFVSVMIVGGLQVITLAMPDGLVIPESGSIDTGFSYEVASDLSTACSAAGIITTSYQQIFPPIACTSEPGGFCMNDATAIIGSNTIMVDFTEINIANLTIDNNDGATYSGTFDILDEDLPTGESITLEVFCADDMAMTAPIGTFTVNGPVTAGTTDIAFTIPYGAECEPADGIVKISPTTTGGVTQCVCAETTSPIAELPVEFSYFKVTAEEDCTITVEWGTLSELNNDYFELEYSVDGKDFKTISQVKGAGTSLTSQNYSYLHQSSATISYYRLKQVDFDGKSTYSDVVAVRQACDKVNNKLEVYPTPTTRLDLLQVRYYHADETDYLSLKVLNLQGKMIKSFEVDLTESGWNSFELDISDLPVGVHYLINHLGNMQRIVIVE